MIFLKLSSIINYKLQQLWPQGLFITLCPISRHQATNCSFEVIESCSVNISGQKKSLAHKASPPPGLHNSHMSWVLPDDHVCMIMYLVEIFHRCFSELINELRLIPSSKHYGLQHPDKRQIVVAGLEFCSISHSIIRFSELRKPLNGPLHPTYSILSLVTPNIKSGVNTLAVNTVLSSDAFCSINENKRLLLSTYFRSFYWTHSSSTFSISSTKQGLIHK